jgi:hypothetical protein
MSLSNIYLFTKQNTVLDFLLKNWVGIRFNWVLLALFQNKLIKNFTSFLELHLFYRIDSRCQFHQHFTRGFFVQKLCANLFCMYLHFGSELFLAQKYWCKFAHKMLVKLTTGVLFRSAVDGVCLCKGQKKTKLLFSKILSNFFSPRQMSLESNECRIYWKSILIEKAPDW